ncbi:hypothetical protein ACN28G_06365 [Micromonospora sp. WMMA1923]|uniref:hypothetical protein n=1 Tax=Micromonospora sp. WMMA1923 TaxID=3404125 RepID=UPI003B95E66D
METVPITDAKARIAELDSQTLADLRQSQEEFAAGDTFSADEVRAELERRRSRVA